LLLNTLFVKFEILIPFHVEARNMLLHCLAYVVLCKCVFSFFIDNISGNENVSTEVLSSWHHLCIVVFTIMFSVCDQLCGTVHMLGTRWRCWIRRPVSSRWPDNKG